MAVTSKRAPKIPQPRDLPPGSQEWARYINNHLKDLQKVSGRVERNVLVLGKDDTAILNMNQRQGNDIRESRERIEEAQEQIDLAQGRLLQAEEELTELNEVTLPALEQEIGQNQFEMEQLQGRMNDVDGELTDLNTSLADLDTELANLGTNLQGEIDGLQQQIDDIIIDGPGGVQIVYSSNTPSGTDFPEGSTWYQWNSNREIVAQWTFEGGSWVSVALNDQFIPNLNAGKITSGTIHSDRIGADSITAGKIAADAITGREILAGSITALDAVFENGAIVNADIANLNATKINAGILSADRIGAGTITGAKLEAGSITGREITADEIVGLNITGSTITGTTIVGADITGTNTLTGGQLNVVNGNLTITNSNRTTFEATPDYVDIGGAGIANGGRLRVTAIPASGAPALRLSSVWSSFEAAILTSYPSSVGSFQSFSQLEDVRVKRLDVGDGSIPVFDSGLFPFVGNGDRWLWGPDNWDDNHAGDGYFMKPAAGSRDRLTNVTITGGTPTLYSTTAWVSGLPGPLGLGLTAASGGIRVQRPGVYMVSVDAVFSSATSATRVHIYRNGTSVWSQLAPADGSNRRLYATKPIFLERNDLIQMYANTTGSGSVTMTTDSSLTVVRVSP